MFCHQPPRRSHRGRLVSALETLQCLSEVMALPLTHAPSSPSSTGSFDLVEGETLADSGSNAPPTDSDGAVSPMGTDPTSHGEHVPVFTSAMSSVEDDYVLVAPGSSLFGPSRSRTASFSSHPESLLHSLVSVRAPVDDRDHGEHPEVGDAEETHDMHMSDESMHAEFLPSTEDRMSTPSPNFPVIEEETSRPMTPVVSEPSPMVLIKPASSNILQDSSNISGANWISITTDSKTANAPPPAPIAAPLKKKKVQANAQAAAPGETGETIGSTVQPKKAAKKAPKVKSTPGELPQVTLPLDAESAIVHEHAVKQMNE